MFKMILNRILFSSLFFVLFHHCLYPMVIARYVHMDKNSKTHRVSLPVQIIIAVAIAVVLGVLFPNNQLGSFSEIGKVIIHWVKLAAGPFLFFTIVASIIETYVTVNHGLRLIAIALLNTSVAIVIGMTLARFLLGDIDITSLAQAITNGTTPDITLSFSNWVKTLTPSSLLSPFVQNEILLIALLALVFGIAIRTAISDQNTFELQNARLIFETLRSVMAVVLQWLIRLIPLAVLAAVAGSVSKHGFQFFIPLLSFILVVLLGFLLQAVLVYGTWIFLIARIPPKVFLREAKSAVLYAFGTNSSLATLPLTLKSLKCLGVSERSASLGAGVATNLNNDGIVLYEAMAVFFIAQMTGHPLTETQMVIAALACIVASMGITGIPEAGFVSLSVVVSTLGLPTEVLPLLLSVDWLVARARSVVNVLSDMTLSIAMDATETQKSPSPEVKT